MASELPSISIALGLSTLAQLPAPTPDGLYTWLAAAVCLLGIYYLVLKIVQAHRRYPSVEMEMTHFARREHLELIQVQLPSFATKGELQAVGDSLTHQLISAARSLDEAVKHLDERRSVSIATIHTALSETKERVAALAATGEIRTQQFGRIEAQIGHILERLPRPRP